MFTAALPAHAEAAPVSATTILAAQAVSLDLGFVAALALRWIADRQIAARTADGYIRRVRRFCTWAEAAGMRALDRQAVRSYAAALEAAGYAVSTRNAYMSAVRSFCAWCTAEGLLARNPADGLSGGRQGRGHRRDAVSGADVRRMMAAAGEGAEGRRNRALVALLAACGLRINEARMADVRDLRTQDGRDVIAIRHAKGYAQGEEAAVVPVPAPVMDLLRTMLADRPDAAPSDPLFCGCANRNLGRRLSHSGIRKAVTEIMRRAGAKTGRTSCHSLRHHCATAALDGGAHLDSVQLLLRHSSPEITMRYAHDMRQVRNTAADVAARAFM